MIGARHLERKQNFEDFIKKKPKPYIKAWQFVFFFHTPY